MSQTKLSVMLRNVIPEKSKLNLKVMFPHLTSVAVNFWDFRFAVLQDNKVYISFSNEKQMVHHTLCGN